MSTTPAPAPRPVGWVGVVALVLTVASVNVVFPLLSPAKHDPDIVALEFAPLEGDGKAKEIIDTWQRDGRIEKARWNVRFDYLFILCYSTTLYLACRWAGREFAADGYRWAGWLGRWIAVLQVAAGGCDMVENVFLLLMLEPEAKVEQLAGWECTFASAKALLVLVGLVYLLVAFARAVVRLLARPQTSTPA